MGSSFDLLSAVMPGREGWRFKVRVLRMWEVPSFLNPEQPNSIEMVLIDEKGTKIHATIRKQLLYVFQKKLTEGDVYKMSYFSVAPNVGSYKTTAHEWKLVFQMKTKVQKSESSVIPSLGLSLTRIEELYGNTINHDHLVDVIGLMTGISAEREYVRDGKVTKMIVFELTDDSGKVECALFGVYVDILQKLMGKSTQGMPVVVVQFAKIKNFREKASIQNVMNTTRIYLNPAIDEAVKFKEGIAVHGVEPSAPVPVIGPRMRPSFEDDFLRMYPAKSILELNSTQEDGAFVVFGVIDDLVEGQEWWYPACKCHRSVTPDSGAYYCKGCVKHVFHMVPRYKVKLCVSDGTDDAVFVVFDGDMHLLVGVPCTNLVSSAKAENAGFYPPELIALKGRKMLFKVEKTNNASVLFDGSFRVKRVCFEPSIVEAFHVAGKESTPLKKVPTDDDSDADEEVDVVKETQTEESVTGLIGFEHGVAPAVTELDDTSTVVEQVMALPAGLADVNPVDGHCRGENSDGLIVKGAKKGFAVPENTKRNLSDAFEEADVGVIGIPAKVVKIEKK